MKTWMHFLVSAILAILLYPAFGWKALFIIAGGVLIDIDHYLWYIFRHKSLNIFNSYKFFIKNLELNDFTKVKGILLIFHTIEFLLAMIFLSFYFDFALLFTIGLLGHYLLDFIWLYHVPKSFITNPSIMWWIIKKFKRFK